MVKIIYEHMISCNIQAYKEMQYSKLTNVDLKYMNKAQNFEVY